MKVNTIFLAVFIGACFIDSAHSQGRWGNRFKDFLNKLPPVPSIQFPLVDPPLTNTEEGICPTDVNVISEFDKDQYLGLWYEIARYPVPYERNLRCVTAEYSNAPILPDWIVVNNSGKRIGSDESSGDGAQGRAYASDPSQPGKLTVTFSGIEPARDFAAGFFPGIGLEPMRVGNYWIIDTDYTTYSLVHSCRQTGRYRTMANWILFRTPDPEKAAIQEALDKFEEIGVATDVFHFTNQTDCGYE